MEAMQTRDNGVAPKVVLRARGFGAVALASLDDVADAARKMGLATMAATGKPFAGGTVKVGDATYRVSPNGNVWDGETMYHGRKFDGTVVRFGRL